MTKNTNTKKKVTGRTQAERNRKMKRKLLEATEKVILTKGFAGLRIADVVDVVKVSKGALLHHFSTKDELIVALVEDLYRRSQTQLTELEENSPLETIVEQLVRQSRAFFFSKTFDISLELTVGTARNADLSSKVFEVIRHYRIETEQAWIDRLIAAGVPVATANDAVDLTNGMIRGLAVRSILGVDESRLNSLQATCVKMIVRLVEADSL